MSCLEVAEEFVAKAQLSRTQADLFSLLEAVAREIGFTYFALVQHVDLNQPIGKIIRLDNYPESWSSYFVENKLFAVDPVHQASLLSNVGFSWEDVPKKICLTKRQRQILAMAANNANFFAD